MTEAWKTIPGFEHYEASDLGRIRSKPRLRHHKDGSRNWLHGRVLTEMVQSGKGYKRVNLYRDKHMSQHGVHCLVALAFLGEPSGRYVNHKDFDVTNNQLTNLEYVSPARNVQYSAEHGRLPGRPGESNPQARLTERDVLAIASRIRSRERDAAIAVDFGVAKGTVTAIRLGKIWSHATGFHLHSFRVVCGRRKAAELLAAGQQLAFAGVEESTGVARFDVINDELLDETGARRP